MINNLFRLLFTATLAVGAVVAVIGHSMQGGLDAKMVHTVQKKGGPPKDHGFRSLETLIDSRRTSARHQALPLSSPG